MPITGAHNLLAVLVVKPDDALKEPASVNLSNVEKIMYMKCNGGRHHGGMLPLHEYFGTRHLSLQMILANKKLRQCRFCKFHHPPWA